jgi:hypothetical protein
MSFRRRGGAPPVSSSRRLSLFPCVFNGLARRFLGARSGVLDGFRKAFSMEEFAGGVVRGKTRLFWDVNDVVANKLASLAKAAGKARNLYVQQLCDAAYSARIAPSGDAALDAAVRGEVAAPDMGSGAADRAFAMVDSLRAEKTRLIADLAAVRGELETEQRRARDGASLLSLARFERDSLREALASAEEKLGVAAADIAALNTGRAALAESTPSSVSTDRALTSAEARIVRGFKAAGRSIASIAAETGFSREAIASALKAGARK